MKELAGQSFLSQDFDCQYSLEGKNNKQHDYFTDVSNFSFNIC